MNGVALAFAIASAACGARSAWLWHKASRVQIIPLWKVGGRIEPVDLTQGNAEWVNAILQTVMKSGDFNRRAAIWTAWATGLAALAALTSALASLS